MYPPELDSPSYKKPKFTCSKCEKSYCNKQNLTRHLNYECGKEPKFQCVHCLRYFKHNSDLKKHIKKMHKDVDNIIY